MSLDIPDGWLRTCTVLHLLPVDADDDSEEVVGALSCKVCPGAEVETHYRANIFQNDYENLTTFKLKLIFHFE